MQSEQLSLPELALGTEDSGSAGGTESPVEELGRGERKPRFKAIDRSQLQWRTLDIDKLIAEDHPARAIWEFVGGLDLSAYRVQVRAVEGVAGRSAINPQLLISLWIYAYSQGVNSGRAISRLCESDPAYQWLTGGEEVSGHTLSDFRVENEERLKQLFVQVLAALSGEGMITLERVAQDGTKIKALAAPDSFRSEEGVSELLKKVREHVEAVDQLPEEESSERMAKARDRGRRERQQRLEAAQKEFEKLEAEGNSKSKSGQRVSTTDPDARVMKQPDGGYAPSYNLQLSTDAANKVVVGVGVTQAGNDYEQLIPAVERVEQNLNKKPEQMLADGGYVSRENIVKMAAGEVEFIGPQCDDAAKGASSYERRGVAPEYYTAQFVYDAESDSFRCPQGKTLAYEGKYERDSEVSYRYRAQFTDCQGCPAKKLCCPGNQATGRSVHRTEELPEVTQFREKMKTEAAREIYRQRAEIAETPNLWIKAKFRLRQFCVRGLRKVGMEALWACLAYNIRLWIRLRWRQRLLAVTAGA